jgi:kojibiose phosphorylase
LRSTEGIHAANCGGNWQTVVHGFAGIASAVDAEEPAIAPQLPPSITRIRTRYVWHGLPLVVDVRPGAVRVENRSDKELSVTVAGVRARLAPRGQAELAY